jgi:curved DNA-binding protein CbpA
MGSRRQESPGLAALKTRTHFEVLGIERGATEQQVKEAYFRLARRFHPDSHHDATLADLVDQLEAVFIRLGEAYEVLKTPRLRADYEERLGRQRPRPGSVRRSVASLDPEPRRGGRSRKAEKRSAGRLDRGEMLHPPAHEGLDKIQGKCRSAAG